LLNILQNEKDTNAEDPVQSVKA